MIQPNPESDRRPRSHITLPAIWVPTLNNKNTTGSWREKRARNDVKLYEPAEGYFPSYTLRVSSQRQENRADELRLLYRDLESPRCCPALCAEVPQFGFFSKLDRAGGIPPAIVGEGDKRRTIHLACGIPPDTPTDDASTRPTAKHKSQRRSASLTPQRQSRNFTPCFGHLPPHITQTPKSPEMGPAEVLRLFHGVHLTPSVTPGH